jgi:hypothetical protein
MIRKGKKSTLPGTKKEEDKKEIQEKIQERKEKQTKYKQTFMYPKQNQRKIY